MLSNKLLDQARRRQEELQEKRDRRNKAAKRKKCDTEEDEPPPVAGMLSTLVTCISTSLLNARVGGRMPAMSCDFNTIILHVP
jgi:hypothetical protein